ncbi:MAG TPA: hypothetical protein VK452_04035 [Dissulfurispiraceae bacterium]|nr:hypothetical protein [Dissulfurispiraceae bacterium]
MSVLLNLFRDFALEHDFAHKAFIVGGTVRDFLLGRQIKDADIAVNKDAIGIGRSLASAVKGSFVVLDDDYGIVRVVKGSEHIDICAMRGNSISDDLAERDLSINAMAIPLSASIIQESLQGNYDLKQFIIDPHNGCRDLKYGIIRMVSEQNLIKDPLRLLRIYRFAAELNFTVDAHTSSAVHANAALISQSAVERITNELKHTMQSASSYNIIKDMEKSSLLFHLFPEFLQYPDGLWRQTRHSYRYMEHILLNLDLYFPDRCSPIQDYISVGSRSFCLKLATLFEDSKVAEKISGRLKLSRLETDFITMLTANDNIPIILDETTKRPIIHQMKGIGDNIYAVTIYSLATKRICQLSESSLVSTAREIVRMYQEDFMPRYRNLPLINGNDLTSEFRLSPSPLFKEILSAIEMLVLEGKIKTRLEALAEAQKIIAAKKTYQ